MFLVAHGQQLEQYLDRLILGVEQGVECNDSRYKHVSCFIVCLYHQLRDTTNSSIMNHIIVWFDNKHTQLAKKAKWDIEVTT